MAEQEQEDVVVAASEQNSVESQDNHQEEQKMVPLAALQAERRKRQELETRAKVYEDMLNKQPQAKEEEEEEDPQALVTKESFRQEKALTKRKNLEQVYQDMNPEAVQKINTYLKPILDKKPWLAATLDSAVNRLARANEIVDDYMHLVAEKPLKVNTSVNEARRIVEIADEPRSTTEVEKSAQPSGVEYLKSIQGKKECSEYRHKLLRGEV